MWIGDLIMRMTGKAVTAPASDGKMTAAPRTLSADEVGALSQLSTLLFDHLSSSDLSDQKSEFKKMYLAGESFFTSMRSAESEGRPSTYLYTDVNAADEAVETCATIAIDRGIKKRFSGDTEDGAVDKVIEAFDLWLQTSGYRFLQDTDVDWAYAGVVIEVEKVDALLAAAAKLGLHLHLGCKA